MKLYELVKDIENVADKQAWRVQPYLVDQLYELTDTELHDVVITDKDKYVPRQEFDQTVEGYFQDSDLLLFDQDETHIKMGGSGGQSIFEFIDFGTTDRLIKRLRLDEQHIDLMHTSIPLVSLRGMFFVNCEIQTISDYYFINKIGSDRSVVVKAT